MMGFAIIRDKRMRKRLRWRTVWCASILGALLVMASLDSRPDPPGVDPHMAALKVPGPAECGRTLCGASGTGLSPHLLALFRIETSILLADIVPDCPTSILVEMGQAADSSPPARIFQS